MTGATTTSGSPAHRRELKSEQSPLLAAAVTKVSAECDYNAHVQSRGVEDLLVEKLRVQKIGMPRGGTSTYGTLPLNQGDQGEHTSLGMKKRISGLLALEPELDGESGPVTSNQSETESDSDGSCGSSATQPPAVLPSILRGIRIRDFGCRSMEKKNSSVGFVIDISDTDDEDDEYDDENKRAKAKLAAARRQSCTSRCYPRRLTLEEKAELYRVRPDLELTPMPVLLRDMEEKRRRRQRKLVFTMLGGMLILLMTIVMALTRFAAIFEQRHHQTEMDAAAQRARDRDAFRWFLQKHRYAPQGRNARAGMLEEKDLDALARGSLAPVWAWTWENVKNAEDMEIIKRNVSVARYTVDSCKHEREQARAKKEKLLNKKKYLQESLARAREREQALFASLRVVEHEQDQLIQATSDKKQRELLKNAFNTKNNDTTRQLHALVDQALRLATVDGDADATTTPENQIDILLSEFKRMLKTTEHAESVDFGDSDIAHLRGFSGSELLKWLLEIASRPHEDTPDDLEEASYAAHVEEHSSTSHDALVQIQSLLRQSQAEHIARFVETQKTYAKAHELKQRVDHAMHAQYDLWGNGDSGADPSNHDLAVETVDLQIQSHVNAVALNYATRAYDDVSKRVDSHRQQKQELDHKVELMNRFEERQDDIVAQIRAKFRQNQELLQSLTRKQTRLLRGVADEPTTTTARVEQESDAQATMQRTLVMDELRAFASLRLSALDTTVMRKPISHQQRPQETIVPFDDFSIHQIRDEAAHLNGYRRLAHALGLPEYRSWLAILEALNSEVRSGDEVGNTITASTNTMTAQEASNALRQLENDVNEDRTQTIPVAQSLLGSLHQLRDNMTSTASSKLDDVVHVNSDTLQHQIPELNQAIENWYLQPAWAARVEQEPVGGLQQNQSMAMELDDLLR